MEPSIPLLAGALVRRWLLRFSGVVGVSLIVAATVGATYERIRSRRDLQAAPPPGRLVDVGGYRLHLWCSGTGAPVVVFDSGLGGTAVDWYGVRREVSAFTTACAYDRAGMGYSDEGPSPRTSEQIAGELATLLERGGVKTPVVLVGWSDGGLYARAFASEHEKQVAGLVLVDAAHEDQLERFASAGFSTNASAIAPLVPIAARLGILRLASRPFGPQPEREPEAIRRFVQATVYRASRYSTMLDE
jgi:pimeloyl-ACP methyl ester carboxylesterase